VKRATRGDGLGTISTVTGAMSNTSE